MRCSHRTLITVTCVLLVSVVCWPMLNLTIRSNAAAQPGPPAAARTMKKGDLFVALTRARIEAVLAEPIPDVELHQMPLREVLVKLKELTGITMYFDGEEVGDIIDPDVPVDVKAAANSMTFKTLINKFILEPNDLTFVIRDNYLTVMSYDKSLTVFETAVYNCRDLLVGIPVQQVAAAPSGVSGGQETFSDIGAREQQLVDVIRSTIRNDDCPWDDGSDPDAYYLGTIEAFNGVLVIRTLPEMHERVRKLLRLLRASAEDKDWPADLGDWPHRKRIPRPPQGMTPTIHGMGSGYF